MKNTKKRLFIGIELSKAARTTAVNHISALRKAFPEARVGWERSEKLHITLKFLGDVDAQQIERIEKEVRNALRNVPSFPLRLERTGVFPNPKKPRILWLGLADSSSLLRKLFENLTKSLAAIGFEKDKRKFIPHLTIGRVREPGSSILLAKSHIQTQFEPIDFNVSEIVIFESKLQPTGSIYKILERIPI